MKKAEKLEEIYAALRKEPLELDELEFFRETSAARGVKVRQRLANKLRHTPGDDRHILLYGYKGCGKIQRSSIRRFPRKRCIPMGWPYRMRNSPGFTATT